MLRVVLIGVAAVIVALVAVVALRPAEFRVARSTTIAAPAPAVFAQVNDFHAWEAWNPWGKIDPEMRASHTGEPAGPGAMYSWWGNRDVGEGRMTITDARPNELVRIRLEFFEPFAATNTAEFTFGPSAGGTAVTWSMTGRNNFVTKAVGLFLDMDKMIGDRFEQGLADMKAIVERSARSS